MPTPIIDADELHQTQMKFLRERNRLMADGRTSDLEKLKQQYVQWFLDRDIKLVFEDA